MKPQDKLIVALDYSDEKPALELARRLEGKAGAFKVGSQLFTARGPHVVEKLRAMGFEVFLDMKYHDIPNTVAGAAAAAAELGVFMMTMHASGGAEMMLRAREAVEKAAPGRTPLLIAITALTSMNAGAWESIGMAGDVKTAVIRLARLAQASGMDGAVSSPEETAALRAALGADFRLITPGIRPAGSAAQDQKRIASPAAAVAAGADYLVVGRPVTQAADPAKACDEILAEIGGAL
ncbi:MAG: orotidine-5'-phosphate decarboxylase [Elusimicrobiales bacterium]